MTNFNPRFFLHSFFILTLVFSAAYFSNNKASVLVKADEETIFANKLRQELIEKVIKLYELNGRLVLEDRNFFVDLLKNIKKTDKLNNFKHIIEEAEAFLNEALALKNSLNPYSLSATNQIGEINSTLHFFNEAGGLDEYSKLLGESDAAPDFIESAEDLAKDIEVLKKRRSDLQNFLKFDTEVDTLIQKRWKLIRDKFFGLKPAKEDIQAAETAWNSLRAKIGQYIQDTNLFMNNPWVKKSLQNVNEAFKKLKGILSVLSGPLKNSCSKLGGATSKLSEAFKKRWPHINSGGLVSLGVLGKVLQGAGISAQAADFFYDSAWEQGYRALFKLSRECRREVAKPCFSKTLGYLTGAAPDYLLQFSQMFGGDDLGELALFMCSGGKDVVKDSICKTASFLGSPEGCAKEFEEAKSNDPNLKYLLAQNGCLAEFKNNGTTPEEVVNGCNLTDDGISRLTTLLDELNNLGDKIENKNSQCSRIFPNKKPNFSIASLTPPFCLFATYNINSDDCDSQRLAADEAWNKFVVNNSSDDAMVSYAREARDKCLKLRQDYAKKNDEIEGVFKDRKFCKPNPIQCSSFNSDSTGCIKNGCKWDGSSCSNKPPTSFS